MPELPEVETTRRGIEPWLAGQIVRRLRVHERRLRWPVPPGLERRLVGQVIQRVDRRAKYLLLQLDKGTLIIHLGMSGSLRMVDPVSPRLKHDHIELELANGGCLRYCDPRRFGAWLWTDGDPAAHPLLAALGPEPLTPAFSASYLQRCLSGRRQAIKTLLMDNHIVVGVGNIYANEALFLAGIHPARPGASLASAECRALVRQVKAILARAIRQGGTTLRDFVGGDGKPGYFAQQLYVYGREGEACKRCGATLEGLRLGQRATVFCPACQA